MMTTTRSGQNAFSLIEILVSAAIIAGLIALLLPAASHVMEKSRGARCLSNLKQIGQAVLLYGADHQMNLPPVKQDQSEWFKLNNPASWLRKYGAAGSEEGAKGLLRCPADPTGPPFTDYKHYYSYSANADLLDVYIDGVPVRGGTPVTPVKAFEAQRKILFADGLTQGEAPGLINKYPSLLTHKNAENRISSRHHGGAYCLFGDGSVQWLSKQAAIDPDWYLRNQ